VKDAAGKPESSRSNCYRDMAGALRALVPKLKQPESRLELQQLAEEYERLASFTQSRSAARSDVKRCADESLRRSVFIIVADNSLDN
jgi:hypothetical protein